MVVVESSEGAGPCNLAELSTGRLDQIRSIVPELDKKCSTTLSRAGWRRYSTSADFDEDVIWSKLRLL